jgi:hypothetical protein
MKFLRQNFVTEIAAVVPSLVYSLGVNGAGLVSSPQQPAVNEPHCGGGETGNSSGVSRFR